MENRNLRVLELFCGMGGLHWALKETNVDFEVLSAMDINPKALQLYSLNFPDTPTFFRNIKSVTAEELNAMKLDVIVMSPPCQPFCRTGNQMGIEDPRSDPLAHLITILDNANFEFFFLENVKGFDTSIAREKMILLLEKKGLFIKEMLLNPIDFGIPNSRLRYYLCARKCQRFEKDLVPTIDNDESRKSIQYYLEENKVCSSNSNSNDKLLKYTSLDIVTPDSTRSCCFTKAYSRYFKATSGSVLAINNDGKLRLFTPREVSRLLCYPVQLQFGDLTEKELYALLGNSVNVFVCRKILKFLFTIDIKL